MHLDPGWFFASTIVAAVGFVLLYYGRKMARLPQLVVGLAMLIYPYFIHSIPVMALVSAGLVAALWLAIRLGW